VSQVAVQPSWQISDHDLVINWLLSTTSKTKPQFVSCEFHSLKNIDWSQFQNNQLQSELLRNPATSADDFADQLDIVALSVLDKHWPLQHRRRLVSSRRENRWLSAAARNVRRQCRKLERLWRATRLADDYIGYRKQCLVTNKVISLLSIVVLSTMSESKLRLLVHDDAGRPNASPFV
jgi:hypothetical protein